MKISTHKSVRTHFSAFLFSLILNYFSFHFLLSAVSFYQCLGKIGATMESPIEWTYRPVREGSSEVSSLNVGQHFLYLGGVNLSFLRCETYIETNTKEVAEIVMDYLVSGDFQVFCVHGISYEVLKSVRRMMWSFDPSWETSSYADSDDESWISHVVFFKTSILTFTDMAVSKLEHDSFFNYVIEDYDLLSMNGLVSKKPIDCCGFVVVLKLVKMENSYVKILSMALPPLTYEKPVQSEKKELFRNLYLKKALYTLFRVPEAPADSNCYYFVYGSINITEGVDLQKSPMDEILTAGQLTMILPEDEFGDFDKPNATKVEIEKFQYFDPELLAPLSTQGMAGFLYHSKNTVTQALCKKRMMASASYISKSSHGNPCGGRFLLLDREDTTGAEAS